MMVMPFGTSKLLPLIEIFATIILNLVYNNVAFQICFDFSFEEKFLAIFSLILNICRCFALA
jgi:hypothetical protein